MHSFFTRTVYFLLGHAVPVTTIELFSAAARLNPETIQAELILTDFVFDMNEKSIEGVWGGSHPREKFSKSSVKIEQSGAFCSIPIQYYVFFHYFSLFIFYLKIPLFFFARFANQFIFFQNTPSPLCFSNCHPLILYWPFLKEIFIMSIW